MGKFAWGIKTKKLLEVVKKLLKTKSLLTWHHPAMFCLITSSKHSRQKFEFSLKVKVMGSNPSYYLLKSFPLYVLWFTVKFLLKNIRKILPSVIQEDIRIENIYGSIQWITIVTLNMSRRYITHFLIMSDKSSCNFKTYLIH